MKRRYDMPDTEPDQATFELPSEGEHLFQVSDIFTCEDQIGQKMGLNENTVSVKCEVVGGKEAGRTLLNRLSLDMDFKGFFATRLFLKAIGEPYKGKKIDIDTDIWQSKQFYATVVHNGKYANIDTYSMDKNPIGTKKETWNEEEEGPNL